MGTISGGYADCNEVEQGFQVFFMLILLFIRKTLHEFVSHHRNPTMFERVGIFFQFRIEDCCSARKFVVGHVMVADDEVYIFAFGVSYFLHCFYTAVESDNECNSAFFGIVYTLRRNAISLVITVGDIIFEVGIKILKNLYTKATAVVPSTS